MTVVQVKVLVGRWIAVRQDFHKGPARISKMDRAGRKPGDWLGQLHLMMKSPRIVHTNYMGNVKEKILPDGHGLPRTAVGIEPLDGIQKIFGKRRCPYQHIALFI